MLVTTLLNHVEKYKSFVYDKVAWSEDQKSLEVHVRPRSNWFRAKGQFSAGVVERLNNKAKVTMRKSYGFRTPETLELALYHNLAKLPEPNFTHTFW